ncbi:molecular chaperone DnaJ [Fontibacter flavus]|uniref:Molecular chaperone DnaJ n=1 Tax=Fontibacter flavus TaxID=654838 RepID=A0ABV6FX61_9BACT
MNILNNLKIKFRPALIFAFLIFLLTITESSAQVRPALGGGSRLYSNALAEMENGDYEKANTFFRQIIESGLPISPEMPYFFAVTLYELKQYDNSLNFIKRYLQINGRNAEKYDEAKELEQKLEEPIRAILACNFCSNQGYRIHTCPTCEGKKQINQTCSLCKGRGIVGCNKCFGKGLLTKRNVFNIIEYYECDKCNGEGKHTCPTCDGNLTEFSDCKTCQGHGFIQSEEICDHQPSPRHMSLLFEKMKQLHSQ